MLKKIGTSARLQIERMLGTKVFLELYGKSRTGWRDSRRFVEELDWRRQLEPSDDGTRDSARKDRRAKRTDGLHDDRNQTED